MREKEFLQCLHFNTLLMASGEQVNQSVAIVCPMTEEERERLKGAKAITLT